MRRLILASLSAALLLSAACENRSATHHSAQAAAGSTASSPASTHHVQSHAPPAPPAKPPATSRPVLSTDQMTPKQLYIAYCGSCHSLELVESQRLDRAAWQWVMSDVVNEYGGTWITPKEQKILIDYLVEHYGPPHRSGG